MSTAKQLPPPLPPETRTVGQVVAEAIRLYSRRWRLALPLGIPLAAADTVAVGSTTAERIAILVVASPAFTLAFAWASAVAGEVRPGRATWIRALVLGTLAFLPAAFFFPWFALLSVAWLALVGLVVPVVMIEDAPARRAFRRAVELCRADYIHALGSLATLVIVFVLSRARAHVPPPRAGRQHDSGGGLHRRSGHLAAALPRQRAPLLRPGRRE